MRRFSNQILAALSAIALMTALAANIHADAKTDSIAFQGRLTDASDNPVPDGPRALTLSLWTDSVNGTMVYSEVRSVITSKGLYSTCIGCDSSAFTDAIRSGDLWLQTQLAGQSPMTPRTRIRGVPRAMYSSGVNGASSSGSSISHGMFLGKPGGVSGPGFALLLDVDANGDGKPEFVTTDSVSAGASSRLMIKDIDGDGVPDGEIALQLTPTTSGMAIKTKGTGADKNRTASFSSSTEPDSASVLCNLDLNGDGVPDIGASMTSSSTRSELKQYFVTGSVPTQDQFSTVLDTSGLHTDWTNTDGGANNVGGSVEAKESRSDLKLYFETGTVPTQDQFSTVLDTSGLHTDWTATDGGANNVGASVEAKESRSDLKLYFETGTVPTQDQFSTVLDGTGARTDWTSTNGGLISTLSIVAAVGIDPITHSSGAKLSAGGVWTNASDENLKENFRPIDGPALLDKIDALPIRQWNYKSESTTITHIGPTAQDFKGLFGVGESDKTISTIDPSGIALAGIKELHKENSELKAQNAELQKQLDVLKLQIEKLMAGSR